MARLAPVKNTVGEGFDVETSVVAWLACHLLAGIPWAGADSGCIVALHCQMLQDGWKFDDIVVDVVNEQREFRVGCSVKSYPVFGQQGAPMEFRSAAWKERVSKDSPFRIEQDKIALISTAHHPDISTTWTELLDTASAMVPETLARRIAKESGPSQKSKMAFESMRCPKEIDADFHDSKEETAKILASMSLFENDFQRTESQTTQQAIALCQQCLEDSERKSASDLWNAILLICRKYRRKGGTIQLPVLLESLAGRFPLKDHPSYAQDWKSIHDCSQDSMSVIPDSIRSTVRIERKVRLSELTQAMNENKCVVTLGRSGNGKTVLARAWAKSAESCVTVWIRHSDLGFNGGLRRLWALSERLQTLFEHSTKPIRLVLDGLDRCFGNQGFEEAALVLKAASQPGLAERCQILITCCPDDWYRVKNQLSHHQASVEFSRFTVDGFSSDELKELKSQLPELGRLFQRNHLKPLLSWPKILDMVASHWTKQTEAPSWTTESDFVRWFWQSAILGDDPMSLRGTVMQKLGRALAEGNLGSISVTEFSPSEVDALKSLCRDRHLLYDETSQSFRFSHDLVADFSRLRALQANRGEIEDTIRSNISSPIWHRAVRLYGLDLLEREGGADAWKDLFEKFGNSTSVDDVAQNLLLESPVFAIDQKFSLEQIWDVLRFENGRLLKRFLKQFLRVATVPDDYMLASLPDDDEELRLHVMVNYRWPFGPYWPGVLLFLADHCEEVITLAQDEIADLCLAWLPLGKYTTLGMAAASKLAVESARKFYRLGTTHYSSDNDVTPEEKVCRALLLAAPTLPEEVTDLVLKFSGRKLPDPEDEISADESELELMPAQYRHRGKLKPWERGARTEPVREFRHAFLSGATNELLFESLPKVGEEVLFAVLLGIPREYDSGEFCHDLDGRGFRSHDSSFKTVFWTSGPFLKFLTANPSAGLQAIIRLVNYATDRAKELPDSIRVNQVAPIEFEGKITDWEGHQYTCLWHLGHVFGPECIACALMSLEKWLYQRLEGGEGVEDAVHSILREGRSIALAFVLLALGKKSPDLFLGCLKPFLASPMIHVLDAFAQEQYSSGASTYPVLASPDLQRVWSEWMQMPHRKETITFLALRLSLSDSEWKTTLAGIRELWQESIDETSENSSDAEWITPLMARTDPENYTARREGDKIYMEFNPPPDLIEPSAEDLERFERIERYQKLRSLPLELNRALKEEIETSNEDVEALWEEIEELRVMQISDEELARRTPWDAVCGIMAVTVTHHREWLAAHPEREQQLFSLLQELAEDPPGAFWFGPDNNDEAKWDVFAAHVVTTLWTEDPTEPFLRSSVVQLSMWDRHSVVERLFYVASGRRKELGVHFDQLFSISIRYAQMKRVREIERASGVVEYDWANWMEESARLFMKEEVPVLPSSWVSISETTPGRYYSGDMSNGFDIGHLEAALKWAENLDDAVNETERRSWIDYHHQALSCTVRRMEVWESMVKKRGREDFADHGRKTPYKDESTMFGRVARFLAHLRPSEDHELLWLPIFNLGSTAPYWIERFISEWLREATKQAEPNDALIEQWTAMLEFSEKDPSWNSTDRAYNRISEAREELYGFGLFIDILWKESLRPVVREIRPYLEKWIIPRLGDDHRSGRIFSVLKTEGAKDLRLDSLKWISDKLTMDDAYFWNEESNQNTLADFLHFLLKNHQSEIANDEALKTRFKALALKLSALQHPLGIEVHVLAGHM